MLLPELKTKYGITGTYDGYHNGVDYLFSGNILDPSLAAEDLVWMEKIDYWAITYAICPGGKLITQVLVFKDMEGMEMYLKDEMCIFDDKET